MKILLSSYNPLLYRNDIVVSKTYPSNPGYKVVVEDIVKHFNKTADCIAVKSVKGSFGSSEFVIKARVYDSVEHLQSVEPKPRVKKVEAGK